MRPRNVSGFFTPPTDGQASPGAGSASPSRRRSLSPARAARGAARQIVRSRGQRGRRAARDGHARSRPLRKASEGLPESLALARPASHVIRPRVGYRAHHRTRQPPSRRSAVLGFLRPEATSFERLAPCRPDDEGGLRPRSPQTYRPRDGGISGSPTRASGRPGSARGAARRSPWRMRSRCRALPGAWRRTSGTSTRIQLSRRYALSIFRYAPRISCGLATNLVALAHGVATQHSRSRGYRTAVTQLARRHGLEMTWLGEQALRRAGANAFLAVAAGNGRPVAGIAHLKYRPGRRRGGAAGPRAIGKGILFEPAVST